MAAKFSVIGTLPININAKKAVLKLERTISNRASQGALAS